MTWGYIYAIYVLGGKYVYIGSTVDWERRESDHRNALSRNSHHSRFFQNCYRKYGELHTDYGVLWEGEVSDREALRALEQQFIDGAIELLGRRRVLNATTSTRNPMDDPEVRERHAETRRALAQDPEWRRKQAEAGRKRAQDSEWRRNVAEANRALAQDPEWRRKHAEACAKLAQDPEWRAGIQKRSQNPEWRRNVAAACAKRAKHYVFRSPEGERVEVYNLSAFCRERGLHTGAMSEVASGKRTHHNGWRKA